MREYRMTPQQQNIYDMVRRYPGSCIGNIGGVIRFAVDGISPNRSKEEITAFQREEDGVNTMRIYETVCRVQELNASLRLRVNRDGHLYLSEQCVVPFEVWDGRGEPEEEIRRRITQWTDIPVFTYDSCLVRYLVIETEAYLYLAGAYHHLICDGIGLMKVTEELWKLGVHGDSPLWTDAERDERFLAYLREMERRAVKPLPEAYRQLCIQEHFVFPPRRESVSEKAEVIRQKVQPEFSGQIFGWCERHGLTVEHVFEAALAIHDCGIIGGEWTGFGRVMINRKKKYMDTAGMFTNVLPLVVQASEGKSFLELCHEIKTQEYDMLKCGDVTVGELKSTNQLTGRLYDTCITYRPFKRLPLQHADYMWETECSAVEVPLRILIDEQSDGIWLTYKYLADCYSRKEIQELDRSIKEIIREGMRENVTFCDPVEQSASGIAAFYRSGKKDGSRPVEDVVTAFDRTVREHGDRIFIIDINQEGREITYREAGTLTDRIAERLAALHRQEVGQVQKDGFLNGQMTSGQTGQQEPLMVGLRLSRTMWMPLAVIACLKTGTIFVPVAISETGERLAALRAQIGVILTDEWVEETATEEHGRICLNIQEELCCGDRDKRDHIGCVDSAEQEKCKNGCPEEALGRSGEAPRTGLKQSRQLAYGVHTSGSTGAPKLVRLYRDALSLRLAWMKENFALSGCRVLQKTRNTFDVSVWELLLPAVCGGSLVMLPDGWEREPEKILRIVEQYQVDTMHFVPSMLSVYLSWAEHAGTDGRTFLKRVFSSGEALSPAMVNRFYACFPFTRLYNLYGPAECTIDVAWHACHRGERVTPVGRPVWGTELFVVNWRGQQVPDGYVGEILVTGALVGEGYIGNPQETAAHFCEWNGEIGYHTGDLGYYTDTGELVYTGRMDREIKLRGMRISLSLLEQEAATVSGVQGAAAIVSAHRLILFAGTCLTESELRVQLAKRVAPHYMPDGIRCLAALPYNRSGKCDYDSLRELFERQGTGTDIQEPDIKGYKPGTNRRKPGLNGYKTGINRRNTGSNKYKTEKNVGSNGCRIGMNGYKNAMNGGGMACAGHEPGIKSGTVRLQRILTDTLQKVPGQGTPVSPGDSLRDLGLDSLSIVSWMLALEKQGVKARYEDIAGAGTIRELAKLLETRRQKESSVDNLSGCIAKTHTVSGETCTECKYVQSEMEETMSRSGAPFFLRRLTESVPQERRRGYVLAVPYAGMGIQCFSTLAEAFADRGYELLACDVSGRRWSIPAMADCITAEFQQRKAKPEEAGFRSENRSQVLAEQHETSMELVVIGCCVGSALAVLLAERLKQDWKGTVRLALIGSLPASFLGNADRQKLLWDLIPQPAANLCLSVLQGRRLKVTEGMIHRLRLDARNYVRCLTDWEEPPVEIDTQLFFGTRDALTYGFRRKYVQWNRYLAGDIRVTELAGAYHFCLHSHAERIAEQIVCGCGHDSSK